MEVTEERPNIRIEIQNNLVEEAMEVDQDVNVEEGEISDADEDEKSNATTESNQLSRRIWSNQSQGFTTGVNIFDKEEHEKLQGRAKRFGLQPSEINNFTDVQLQELHDSLGLTVENEKEVRFEAIHMRGTDEMSTEHVLDYFHKFGPSGIEWINDECCNVLWNDKVSAARALYFLSSPVEGMPVEGPCDPFIKELETTEDDLENNSRSILLKNNDREVELEKEEKENLDGKIHVTDITVPIPPGFWRLGIQHNKAKFILLRFAIKSDKKPFRAERFSEYYKKYGNPNFGGLKGIITQSRRQKAKGIFDHNREMKNSREVVDNKNPWGSLAENWEAEDGEAEQQKEIFPELPLPAPKAPSNSNSNILNRLGFKRALSEDKEDTEEPVVEKKSKFPRMRMYADEEEEKVRRRRQLIALKNLKQPANSEKSKDLRDILKIPKKEKIAPIPDETFARKNVHVHEDFLAKSKLRSDEEAASRNLKSRMNLRMNISARFRRERTPEEYKKFEENEKYEKLEEYEENEKYKYEKRRRPRTQNMYEDYEEYDSSKPKSKVAVVIKAPIRPAVASTVWSRINESDRLKTVSEGKLRIRKNSSTNSESSVSSNSSVANSSDLDSSDENNAKINRPGFRSQSLENLHVPKMEHKSPLRIEISNDHFLKKA